MTLPGVTAERMQAAIVQVTEQVPAEVDGGWEVPAESNAVIRFEPPSDNGLLRVAVVSPVKIAQKDYPTVLMVFNEFNMKSTDATLYMTKVPRAMSRRRSNMGLAGEQSSECLGGREIAQSAAGSIVDLLGDGGEVGLVIGDHRALGQILPVEPVRVLVAGPLPGRVGIGEVDRHRRGQGDLRVLGHLAALVPRQRCLHHLGQVVEKLDDRVSGWLGVFRGQGQQPGEPAHPLHQRRRARGAVLPDDQVTLPVPGTRRWAASSPRSAIGTIPTIGPPRVRPVVRGRRLVRLDCRKMPLRASSPFGIA